MRKTTHHIAIACIIGLIRCAPPANAGERVWFVNPGLKLGYTFGRGFTFGAEVSVTYYGENARIIPGIVIGAYSNRSARIFHVSGQVTLPGSLGVGLGPALVLENGRSDVGCKYDMFGLVVIMPHYSHVFRAEGRNDFDELGLYLKLPIVAKGHLNLSLGG